MIFVEILKNIKYIRNGKYRFYLMIWFLKYLLSNKNLNPIVTELFIRRKKINNSLISIIRSSFALPKNITLNSAHYFVVEFSNQRELEQIAFNHSWDMTFKDS